MIHESLIGLYTNGLVLLLFELIIKSRICCVYSNPPGQEGGPGERAGEQDRRRRGGKPAGRQAPGGFDFSSEAGPETASDQGDLF